MPAPPLLLGHRGARGFRSAPENTLRSFDYALQSGCDGFEFDVRLTSDKKAVITHDPRVHGLSVASSSFAQLSRAPRARSRSTKIASEVERLVTIGEVLARYASKAFLDIELKVPGLESIVLEALRGVRPRQDYVISSFLPDVLWELKARSSCVTGMICERKTQLARWPKMPVEYVIVEQKLFAQNLLDELHAARRKVLVWTVNTPMKMRRYAEWGVDGIVSDHPDLLVSTLRPNRAPRTDA